MKKFLKIASSVISWLVISVLVLSILIVTVPQILGMKMYTILTGSMIPTYGVSDLIYVKPASFENIKVDDCITYLINSQGTAITHRVVGIDESKRAFYTKGDNNAASDGRAISYDNVIGVVKFSIPKIGVIIQPITTPFGKIAAVCGILICVILMNLVSYIRKNQEPKKNGEEEKQNNLEQTNDEEVKTNDEEQQKN